MSSRSLTRWVIGTLLVLGAATWLRVFGPHRPYIDRDPVELAEYLVEHQRSPKECWDLVVLDFFGPQPATQRASCIFHVAQLTLDPSVCEYLLPSEHALACLSEVGGTIFEGHPCTNIVSDGVYCNKTFSEGELTIEHAQIQNCSLYKRNDLQEWCMSLRTRELSNVHECQAILNPVIHDECEEGYAFKQKDPSLCAAVKDEKRRTYCEIRINAWLKYPELRKSFYFGIS
jgi:hypothetical protein